MENMQTLTLGIIVVVIFLVIMILITSSNMSTVMYGFWVAPNEFLKDSGLDSLIIYYGKTGSYILSSRDDGILMNDPVDIKVSGGILSVLKPWLSSRKYSINFVGLDYDFFPSIQDMTFYPESSKMILSKKGTVYAVLYRDAELTDTAITHKKGKKILFN